MLCLLFRCFAVSSFRRFVCWLAARGGMREGPRYGGDDGAGLTGVCGDDDAIKNQTQQD